MENESVSCSYKNIPKARSFVRKENNCVVQESRKVKAKGMYQVRAFLFCHSLMEGRRETIREQEF